VKPGLRRATAADLPGIALVDGRAFGFHYGEQDLENLRGLLDLDRFVVALDGESIVGTAGSYEFAVTPPGGDPLAAEGVTWVSVAAHQRRRGIMRAMLTELHRGYVEAGVPLALLTASEGAIYGRFGYGIATADRSVEIDRRGATLRPDVPDPGGARHAETDEVRERVPDIHHRWCARHPGALSRSAAWWDFTLLDRPHQRRGGTARFHLLHPDGYAAYRIDGGTCRVVDFFAVTDSAHLALWRLLLALDLVTTITTTAVGADDPLPFLLTDARAVRTVGVADGMWARVLDVPAVLGARRYGVDVDAVLQVRDPGLDRGGRFRLRGGPDGADCAPTSDAPDLHVDIAALGSLVLGGVRALTLARAGLIAADDPATGEALLRRFDAACTADRDPRHGTGF
jgi:predicted acetyltransferase